MPRFVFIRFNYNGVFGLRFLLYMCISVLVQHDYSDNRTCEGCLSVIYDAEKIGIVQIKDVRKNNDTAMWLKVVRKST